MKKILWSWTREKLVPIINAMDAVMAAESKQAKGHVPLLVWHDKKEEWELTGSIDQISVTNSLHKVYPPADGDSPYAGGIIFFLYFGIGIGIGYTQQQVVTHHTHHTYTTHHTHTTHTIPTPHTPYLHHTHTIHTQNLHSHHTNFNLTHTTHR